ncbi:MAG: metal-dependent hydrolase [Parcubacteria group bacterium Gr01-1014_8]|nr:MAG: metal-dependent hydrolase [Parcubacteria group bacterium Gr01-1014_8]
MKTLHWLVGIVIILAGGFYALNSYIYNEKQPVRSGGEAQNTPMQNSSDSPVEIFPIEHATAVIHWQAQTHNTTFYLDPVGDPSAFAGLPAADEVLVTDIHDDHFSPSTLESVVVMPVTGLIVPQAVKDQLPPKLAAHATVLKNGESLDSPGLSITAIPMYNLPGSSNEKYHTKGRGNGYLIEIDGFRVYIAGDTAGIPEMRALTDIDIALVPMNLPYTMDVDEAANAVLEFKPKQVYPYHYRGQGGLSDVGRFKELVNAGDPSIEVILANWYPQQ